MLIQLEGPEPSDPFANTIDMLWLQSGDELTGTVFYGGTPVMAVTIDSDPERLSTVEHFVGVENRHQQMYVLFLQAIGEMPGDYELLDGTVLEDPVVRVADGENYWDIADQYDGQGYKICEFVDRCTDELRRVAEAENIF